MSMTAPQLSRPYVLTGGRTRGRGDELALEAMALTIGPAWQSGRRVPPEAFDIADICVRPCSMAEIAARLNLPIGVTRVLVADLAADDALRVGETARPGMPGASRVAMLERLLAGVRAL
jgi:Protein of unknown function (DUF742).